MANISPGLVNPGKVELILETRREYAKKLEEVIFPFILVDEVWLASLSFSFFFLSFLIHFRSIV